MDATDNPILELMDMEDARVRLTAPAWRDAETGRRRPWDVFLDMFFECASPSGSWRATSDIPPRFARDVDGATLRVDVRGDSARAFMRAFRAFDRTYPAVLVDMDVPRKEKPDGRDDEKLWRLARAVEAAAVDVASGRDGQTDAGLAEMLLDHLRVAVFPGGEPLDGMTAAACLTEKTRGLSPGHGEEAPVGRLWKAVDSLFRHMVAREWRERLGLEDVFFDETRTGADLFLATTGESIGGRLVGRPEPSVLPMADGGGRPCLTWRLDGVGGYWDIARRAGLFLDERGIVARGLGLDVRDADARSRWILRIAEAAGRTDPDWTTTRTCPDAPKIPDAPPEPPFGEDGREPPF